MGISLFGVMKSKTGHPKIHVMHTSMSRYWQKAHYQENMVNIPVPQNGLQMATEKRELRIQTTFFTSLEEAGFVFKNNRKTPLPLVTLPNRR